MSLDVYIKFKEKKVIPMYRKACGSTVMVCDEDTEMESSYWSANVTHNMGHMASKIPVGKDGMTLYDAVWRPDENGIGTVRELYPLLEEGISYMMNHRKELLQYNPKNGWGDYDSFLQWLIQYHNACEDYPEGEIEVSR